jgi:hypothetical protein
MGTKVKIRNRMTGIPAGGPDFAWLRAQLHQAQSATPTAIASGRARVCRANIESLLRLFGGTTATGRAAGSGSFHAGPTASDEEGDGRRR